MFEHRYIVEQTNSTVPIVPLTVTPPRPLSDRPSGISFPSSFLALTEPFLQRLHVSIESGDGRLQRLSRHQRSEYFKNALSGSVQTYVDVLGQQAIRHFVFVHHVVVHPVSSDDGAKKEAEDAGRASAHVSSLQHLPSYASLALPPSYHLRPPSVFPLLSLLFRRKTSRS